MQVSKLLLTTAVMACGLTLPNTLRADNMVNDAKSAVEGVMATPAPSDARPDMKHEAPLPAGIDYKDLGAGDSIRSSLAALPEKALTRDDVKALPSLLVKADMDRLNAQLKDEKDVNYDTLNGLVAQVADLWKKHYGQDFRIKDYKGDFGDKYVGIHQGVISDPPTLIKNWPAPPVVMKDMMNKALPANMGMDTANTVNKSDAEVKKEMQDANRMFGGDTKLEKGRDVAVVIIPASHGLPQLTLSMIREMPNNWVYNIPNSVDTAKLRMLLADHFKAIIDNEKSWPTDVGDAHRLVTHHVGLALYGIDTKTAQMVSDKMKDATKGTAKD